jgi:hypothetical protein
VDSSNYLAETLAHVGQEVFRIKRATNPTLTPSSFLGSWNVSFCRLSADYLKVDKLSSRRRQKQQMAASEQELTTSEEKMTPVEPQVRDPQAWTGKSADQRGHQLGETKTTPDGLLRANLKPEARVTEPCLTARPDKLPGDSRIPPPEGSWDPRSSKEPRPLWSDSRRRSEGKTAKVDFSNYLA